VNPTQGTRLAGKATVNARIYDYVVLTVDVLGDNGAVIPQGTRGAVIEARDEPTERYTVVVNNIPDDASSTGFRYGSVILSADQFGVAPTDSQAYDLN